MSLSKLNEPRLRFGVNKVRTGCITCKKRRVKCDEGKPECQRCLKAKRTCGGYSHDENEKTLSYQRSTQAFDATSHERPFIYYVANIPSGIGSLNQTDLREKRAINLFQTHIAGQVAGSLCVELFEQFMLLAASHEQAVRHAVVALSTFYETQLLGLQETQDHEFALQSYSKAIKEVVRLNLQPVAEAQAADVALLACIVFATIEGIQGHHYSAMTHVVSGVNVLEEYEVRARSQTFREGYVPRLLFRQLFTRMETQILEIGHPATQNAPPVLNKCLRKMPETFQSVAHATLITSSYLNKLLLFIQSPSLDSTQEVKTADNNTTIWKRYKIRREEFIDNYLAWCQALHQLRSSIDEPSNSQPEMTLLSLYQHFIKILLCIDLNAGESEFEKHHAQFLQITYLAHLFMSQTSSTLETTSPANIDHSEPQPTIPQPRTSATASSPGLSNLFLSIQTSITPICPPSSTHLLHSIPNQPPTHRPLLPKPRIYRPTYTLSLGIVGPLYFTAVRCRDHALRHSALKLLASCNRFEGLWSSRAAYRVAKRFVEIEEGCARQLNTTSAEIQEAYIQKSNIKGTEILEHALVRESCVEFLESENLRIRYRFSRLCRCGVGIEEGSGVGIRTGCEYVGREKGWVEEVVS